MTTISQSDAPLTQGFLGFIEEELDADSIEDRLFDIAASSEERRRIRSIYELQEWLAEIRELAQSHVR